MDLKDIVIKFKETMTKRKELEAEAKTLKATEDSLRDTILQQMQADNMASVKYPDIGHVIITNKEHYEIRDKTLFCLAIMRSLVHTYKSGRPLDDGLIAQARVSKEGFEAYLEETKTTLEDAGLVKVSKPELTVRKA